MKIADILSSTQEMLTPGDVAKIVGVDPQSIRDQAKAAPAMLGFPVAVIGTRVMIPRVAFCRWLGYLPEQINGLPV